MQGICAPVSSPAKAHSLEFKYSCVPVYTLSNLGILALSLFATFPRTNAYSRSTFTIAMLFLFVLLENEIIIKVRISLLSL